MGLSGSNNGVGQLVGLEFNQMTTSPPQTRPGGAIKSVASGTYTGGSGGTYNSDLAFYTGTGGSNAEQVRILSSGNVGIGTAGPVEKLEINGNIKINRSGVAANYLDIGLDTNNYIIYNSVNGAFHYFEGANLVSASNFMALSDIIARGNIRNDNASYLTVTGGTSGNTYFSGNVGIGTASPLRNLHINAAASEASLIFSRADGLANNKNWRIFTNSSGAGQAPDMSIDILNDAGDSARNVMTFLNSGKVGIGTTGPGAWLDVIGDFKVGSSRKLYYSGAGTLSIQANDGGGWANSYSFLGSAGTNVGGFGALGSVDALSYLWAGNSYDIPTMVWKSGNVGIGTASPSRKFHVSGDYTEVIFEDTHAAANTKRFNIFFSNGQTYFRSLNDAGSGGPIWLDADNTSGVVTFPSGYGDLAENYYVAGKILQAGLVSIDNSRPSAAIAADHSHRSLLGIVTTKPGAVMDLGGGFRIGGDTKMRYENEKTPIALVGAVPALVISQNGPISMGDAVGVSLLPGFGAKAMAAGPIVGHALELFNPADSSCQKVFSPEAVEWPKDDGRNSKKPCFRLPDGAYVGKIMVAVNISWYDPGEDVLTTNSSGKAGTGPAAPNTGLRASGRIYQDSTGTKIIFKKPGGACSACGPDDSNVWTCASLTCP